MYKNFAFVIGCDANGYGVIRSLNLFNKNIPIIGIDFNAKAPGLYSKFLSNKIILSNPQSDEEKFIDELINFSKKFNSFPVLFITSDLFLSVINKYREILEKYFLFNLPKKELLNDILDKKKQYKLISEIYDEVPRTYELKNHNYDIINNFDLTFPVFVKGAKTFEWKKYFLEKGFVANSLEELSQIINRIKKYNLDLVIQELITGPNSNHYKVCAYYDRKGEVKLLFTTRKMRQFPVDFGVGCYMISEIVEELLKTGKSIFDKIKFTGVGSIEFKKDERDGKFKLIEINPRFWQQNFQATLAGLNFAGYYYLDCIGQGINFETQFLEGITYMDAVNDFQSFQVNKVYTKEIYFHWIKQVVNCSAFTYFNIFDLKPIIKSSNFGFNIFKYLYKLLFRS
ncbi:MAG: hypothetical protein N2485_08205 [bacterium]|nr:hypothetical protein [bacterium]